MRITGKNLIGQRVRKARLAHKPFLRQADLARLVSKHGAAIDRAGIAKIENGLRRVYDFEIVALARTLKVSATWLLGGRGK